MTRFLKIHGLGNDFVVIDLRNQQLEIDRKLICDRHFGVGCDQLILLSGANQADIYMEIYNADGSKSSTCGNATRCVASLIMEETGKDRVDILTDAGIRGAFLQNGEVAVNMGVAKFISKEIHLYGLHDGVSVDMGNPHIVFFVNDPKNIPLHEIGPKIEYHEFFPNRTNVEFAKMIDRDNLEMRVWERGVGETLACGSGACAVFAVALEYGYIDKKVAIHLKGGVLNISINDNQEIIMSGAISKIFRGELF